MAHITKIGLVDVVDDALLVVLKDGGSTYILPGGKPEKGEDAEQALRREVDEELSCGIRRLKHLVNIRAVAADQPDDTVEVQCYTGTLNAEPAKANEIAEIRRVSIHEPDVALAPSIVDGLLPLLRERACRAYSISHRSALQDGQVARIMFGIYPDDDVTHVPTFEMALTWHDIGRSTAMRIEVFDESIGALTRMTDLLAEIAEAFEPFRRSGAANSRTLSVEQMTTILESCGFRNDTPDPLAEPNAGTPLTIVQRQDGTPVHVASTTWRALDWCRKTPHPFGTLLEVVHGAMDGDEPLDAKPKPFASFEYHDEGTAPVERDSLGRIHKPKD
jgi:8-oxo-dGTP diphosphatase